MSRIGLLGAAALLALSAGTTQALTLTDATVFSTNQFGENYIGWIWNTQGQPADGPNRWNLYYSNTPDPNAPNFINSGNDSNAEISIALNPGIHDFVIFGEQTGAPTTDPVLHYVANLYFDGNQSAPGISGLTGPTCATVCAASHPNGLDIFGASGAAEAGTLSYAAAGTTVSLTGFAWAASDQIDQVWPHFAGSYFGSYSGTPDFVGTMQLTVTAAPVPLPAAGWTLIAAIAGLAGLGRHRRRARRMSG